MTKSQQNQALNTKHRKGVSANKPPVCSSSASRGPVSMKHDSQAKPMSPCSFGGACVEEFFEKIELEQAEQAKRSLDGMAFDLLSPPAQMMVFKNPKNFSLTPNASLAQSFANSKISVQNKSEAALDRLIVSDSCVPQVPNKDKKGTKSTMKKMVSAAKPVTNSKLNKSVTAKKSSVIVPKGSINRSHKNVDGKVVKAPKPVQTTSQGKDIKAPMPIAAKVANAVPRLAVSRGVASSSSSRVLAATASEGDYSDRSVRAALDALSAEFKEAQHEEALRSQYHRKITARMDVANATIEEQKREVQELRVANEALQTSLANATTELMNCRTMLRMQQDVVSKQGGMDQDTALTLAALLQDWGRKQQETHSVFTACLQLCQDAILDAA
eukprot:Platyproteum_vivax@DN976_c0_g1_i1.p1